MSRNFWYGSYEDFFSKGKNRRGGGVVEPLPPFHIGLIVQFINCFIFGSGSFDQTVTFILKMSYISSNMSCMQARTENIRQGENFFVLNSSQRVVKINDLMNVTVKIVLIVSTLIPWRYMKKKM